MTSTFSSGTLTQDIVDGVTINQLFMSGGTLILANPLTLDFGLHFSGGGITSGILDIFEEMSSQTALMAVEQHHDQQLWQLRHHPGPERQCLQRRRFHLQ